MRKVVVENTQRIQKLSKNLNLKIFFIHVTPRDDSYGEYKLNERFYMKRIRCNLVG
jgi:hypothetical protein